jgi:hypothetical protein
MTNARSIINQAARKIGVVGRGLVMPADEAQDALTALNNMVKGFSAGSGIAYNEKRNTYPLTGAISYSIGPGGDFDTTRPDDISSAYVTVGTTDYPLNQINSQQYTEIVNKNIQGIPDSFYYQNNTPLGRIFLYLKGASGYTLTLITREQDASFVDLTTDYNLPEGYEEMLVYNLALRLAPEYEKPVPAEVKTTALASKLAFESFVRRNDYPTSNIDIGTDAFSGNVYNGWYTR